MQQPTSVSTLSKIQEILEIIENLGFVKDIFRKFKDMYGKIHMYTYSKHLEMGFLLFENVIFLSSPVLLFTQAIYLFCWELTSPGRPVPSCEQFF